MRCSKCKTEVIFDHWYFNDDTGAVIEYEVYICPNCSEEYYIVLGPVIRGNQ
jgi:DNA-directed RNA polymerase subunit RPC12/RpoP